MTVSPERLETAWYVRAKGRVDAVRAGFPGVALLSRSGAPAEEVAFLTPVMTGAEVLERLGALEPQSLFRVLD